VSLRKIKKMFKDYERTKARPTWEWPKFEGALDLHKDEFIHETDSRYIKWKSYTTELIHQRPRRRIELTHGWSNTHIQYMTDPKLFGKNDVWQSPAQVNYYGCYAESG
jgi:hypothetical protein